MVAVLLIGCADDVGPRLDAVTPAAAETGAMVTLTGTKLCGATANCATAAGKIELGLSLPIAEAQIVSYADTSAVIVVPQLVPVGETMIVVTVNDQASNGLAFDVLP